jgi:DNA polymerase-4
VSRDASILHVDLDAFFASVEQLLDPKLRGRPVIVGGTGNRGVVSAASYEARVYGVHSAMPMARARRACPDGVFLPPRFHEYTRKSREVMEVLGSVTPLVEQLSVDEAFLDVSGGQRSLGSGREIAALVRRRVRAETGLVASVGVATTKFLAKVASDCSKPDGLLVVEPGTEHEFLAPLPVSRLWGVGPATLRKLERMGIATIGDLASLPRSVLTGALGAAHGAHLAALARNDDPRPVVSERAAKSIGAEETFAEDLRDPVLLDRELVHLVDRAAARLRRAGFAARTVTLKVRYADFETVTRSRSWPAPVATSHVVLRTVRALLASLPVSRGVRLLGVSLSHLGEQGPAQGVLDLGLAEPTDERRDDRLAAVERAVDEVRARFGERAVRSATLVRREDGTR